MHPTILIGLDGATFSVLDPLMAEGHMPRLQRLVAQGVRAGLMSTPHPLTPPAWTTLMTGKLPGHHGIYDFLRAERRPTGTFFTLSNFRDIRTETIWTIVSRLGGRVFSLNFPLMATPPKVNGAIVPGLLSWRHLRLNVHPPELYDVMKALPGFDPKGLNWDFESEKKALQNIPDEELEQWTRFHVARELHWFSILNHLMTNHPAELTAVLFDGVDKLQHGCWRVLDPACLPAQPSAFEARLRALCIEYFRALDGLIGKIVDMGGPSARVFLASDHGFGPTSVVFRVNNWLAEKGLLFWPSAEQSAGNGKLRAGHHVGMDMTRTVAYAQSAATNGIHIRVSEQPGDHGVPAEQYASFRDALIEQLLAVRDPATDQLLIKDVLKREDAFPGPYMEHAPDLTLVMHDHGFVSVVKTDEVVYQRPQVTGTHYPEGVLIASGPGIRRGYVAPTQNILDIAPTLLHSLGLAVPADFQGRVIDEVFEPAMAAAAQRGDATREVGDAEPSDPQIDREEEALILDRLRALGYVE